MVITLYWGLVVQATTQRAVLMSSLRRAAKRLTATSGSVMSGLGVDSPRGSPPASPHVSLASPSQQQQQQLQSADTTSAIPPSSSQEMLIGAPLCDLLLHISDEFTRWRRQWSSVIADI